MRTPQDIWLDYKTQHAMCMEKFMEGEFEDTFFAQLNAYFTELKAVWDDPYFQTLTGSDALRYRDDRAFDSIHSLDDKSLWCKFKSSYDMIYLSETDVSSPVSDVTRKYLDDVFRELKRRWVKPYFQSLSARDKRFLKVIQTFGKYDV